MLFDEAVAITKSNSVVDPSLIEILVAADAL
jgi:hypothetical protein